MPEAWPNVYVRGLDEASGLTGGLDFISSSHACACLETRLACSRGSITGPVKCRSFGRLHRARVGDSLTFGFCPNHGILTRFARCHPPRDLSPTQANDPAGLGPKAAPLRLPVPTAMLSLQRNASPIRATRLLFQLTARRRSHSSGGQPSSNQTFRLLQKAPARSDQTPEI
jgi:hypothetical protein